MENSQRVFIRGNKDRWEEVIKVLTDLGAKQNSYSGTGSNDDYLYFIRHDGTIGCARLGSELSKVIMDNYIELHLPEKWKDGDVLVDRNNSQVMVLYEFVSDKEADLFNAHIRLNGDVIVLHSLEVRNRFRLATDQEIEKFYEILHKHHKDWDAEKKQLVDWKWKPKMGESYFFIDSFGEIHKGMISSYNNKKLFDFGNYFRTKKEAETMAEKIKKLLNAES